MSYQVLARKWRPKSFATLVGQEHVVRALSHALATGRLHHAWLFTGTRGVGKTTISRILAKALNCETGVTADPCGTCDACRAIDADRFPDYVEMDAASNRGVDDMASLLDKAVYAPVQGRYKVYMIDEVHMLTGHAFNAMLKTLEEPPEHVKFILATTDPQKIPVTVLSRCLQFNLKQMPPGHIVDHLTRILEAEAVVFEPNALRHLAKAASGSMRDALSLLDQAIAHGAGKVEEEQVTHMLGTVGDDHLFAVLDALIVGDVKGALAVADAMEARSLSFDAALQSLATLVHRIALAQFAPEAIGDELERARIGSYAAAFDPEYLQLAYQVAIHGRDELSLAPDEYTGFTMSLLRLHAFRPEQPGALGAAGSAPALPSGTGIARPLPVKPVVSAEAGLAAPPTSVLVAAPALVTAVAQPALEAKSGGGDRGAGEGRGEAGERSPARSPRAEAAVAALKHEPVSTPRAAPGRVSGSEPAQLPVVAAIDSQREQAGGGDHDVPPWEDLPPEAYAGDYAQQSADCRNIRPVADTDAGLRAEHEQSPTGSVTATPVVAAVSSVASPAPDPVQESAAAVPKAAATGDAATLLSLGDWRGLIRALELGGLVRELAQHCEWVDCSAELLSLRLSTAHRHLLDMNRNALDRLQDQLAAALGRPLKVKIDIGDIAGETPAQQDEIERRARHAEAVAALEADAMVRELIERFDATLVESSVKPL